MEQKNIVYVLLPQCPGVATVTTSTSVIVNLAFQPEVGESPQSPALTAQSRQP